MSISDVFGHLASDAFLGRCVKWPIYYWIEKKSFKKRKAGHFDIGIWRRISNQGPLPYVTLHPCTRLKLFARWAKNLRNTFVTQSALSTTTIRFKQILHPLFENGPFGRIWNILCENQSRTDAMELIESSKGAILPKSRWNSNLKRGSYPLPHSLGAIIAQSPSMAFRGPLPPFVIPNKSWNLLIMDFELLMYLR